MLLLDAFPDEAVKNRLRKPRIYVREAAAQALSPRPSLGPINELIETEKRLHPSSDLFHSTNRGGRGLDVIVDRGSFRFGVMHVPVGVPRRRRLTPLRRAREQGLIRRGFALHGGTDAFFLYADAFAVPRMVFLGAYADWTARRLEPHVLIHWCNNASVTNLGSGEPTIRIHIPEVRKKLPFYAVPSRE